LLRGCRCSLGGWRKRFSRSGAGTFEDFAATSFAGLAAPLLGAAAAFGFASGFFASACLGAAGFAAGLAGAWLADVCLADVAAAGFAAVCFAGAGFAEPCFAELSFAWVGLSDCANVATGAASNSTARLAVER
jgi:hypothetical protein